MRAWDRTTLGGVGAVDTRAQLAAQAARAAAAARLELGRVGNADPSGWEASARAWVDYAADLTWRAASAPGNYAREQLDKTARTLGQLAKDAHTQGREVLAQSMELLSKTAHNMVSEFWGVPPIVFLLGGVAILAGGGWLLLGTAGGQAVVGGALRAGAGAVGMGARGVAAYATGGATEIARAAL
jgi:hypothetical protein